VAAGTNQSPECNHTIATTGSGQRLSPALFFRKRLTLIKPSAVGRFRDITQSSF